MKGTLYGVGTGPGDKDDLTIKAINTIKNCDVLAFPSKSKDNCTSYNIIKEILPEIEKKELLFLDFPMVKDQEKLTKAYQYCTDSICYHLNSNKNVAFLTIGDTTVYSTYFYIHTLVEQRGYQAIIINGITSFCAVAAKLGISLALQSEEIHIIPGNYDVQKALSLSGTLVFMKSGSKLQELKEKLSSQKDLYEIKAVTNCGLEGEHIYNNIDEIETDAGYFTVVIVKQKTKDLISSYDYSFFQNRSCQMFPCHKNINAEDFNCLFCYCPLYILGDKCGGNFTFTSGGIKSCIDCNVPHQKDNYKKIINRFSDIKEAMNRLKNK